MKLQKDQYDEVIFLGLYITLISIYFWSGFSEGFDLWDLIFLAFIGVPEIEDCTVTLVTNPIQVREKKGMVGMLIFSTALLFVFIIIVPLSGDTHWIQTTILIAMFITPDVRYYVNLLNTRDGFREIKRTW